MSETPNSVVISERIAALEAETKRLRKRSRESRIVTWILLCVVLIGGIVDAALYAVSKRLGIETKGDVKTRRLIITDDEGTSRAFFGTTRKGEPFIELLDRDGQGRWFAYASGDSTGLRLSDAGKRTRVELRQDEQGPIITMLDNDGDPRLTSAITSTGDAVFALLGGDGKRRIAASLPKVGTGGLGLALTDGKGVLRLGFALNNEGRPVVNWFDAEGRSRLVLGESDEGWPSVELHGEDGKARIVLYAHNDGSAVIRYLVEEVKRLDLGLNPNGVPLLTLYDRDESIRASLYLDEDEDGQLHLADR